MLELPDLTEYEQSLVSHWMQIGTVQQNSAGIVSLDWSQIIRWATYFYRELHVEMIEHPRQTNRHKRLYTPVVTERSTLTDWELSQIKFMSNEYVSEYYEKSPYRECPKKIYIDEISEEDALVNAESMESALDRFMG